MRYLRDVRARSAPYRERLLARVERYTELPLLFLAFLMIPLLAGPFVWDLTTAESATFGALSAAIWVLFAVDLAIKTAISPRPLNYLKTNKLTILVVVVPFFRPLRILQVMVFGARAFRGTRRASSVDFIAVYAAGSVVLASTLVTTIERNEASALADYWDSLWWAIVTVTTVGYGDITPVTGFGRAVGVGLMLIGIGLFSALAANMASSFLRFDSRGTQASASPGFAELNEEIRLLREEVRALRR